MLIYFILIALLVVSVFLEFLIDKFDLLKDTQRKLLHNILFACHLVFVFLILILKSRNVGQDTLVYVNLFNSVEQYFGANISWGLFDNILYYCIFYCLNQMGLSFYWATVLIYAVTLVVMYFFIKKYSHNGIMTLFLFVCSGMFLFYLSGLRQMMAITFGMLGMMLLLSPSQKCSVSQNSNIAWILPCLPILKKIGALILMLCGCLIHNTGIVLVIAVALSFYVPSKKILFYSVGGIWLICLLIPNSAIVFFAELLGKGALAKDIGQSSNILLLLIYVCIGVFIIIVAAITDYMESKEERLMFIFAGIGIALMLSSSKYYLLSRLMYYFQFPICIMLTNSMEKIRKQKKYGIVFYVLIMVAFVIYFGFALRSDDTSVVPYEFLWEKN